MLCVVDEVLTRSLEPVLRDIRRTGVPVPRIEDDDWTGNPEPPSAMLWSSDGSGTGIRVDRYAPEAEQVAMVADQVQEWVIEELWGQSTTNWPPCPSHPTTHPLTATTRDGEAVWACPADRTPVCAVGALGAR